MAKEKKVAYPNLVESMKNVVSTHAGIHEAIAQHAAEHGTAIRNKRTQLAMKNSASKLLEGK